VTLREEIAKIHRLTNVGLGLVDLAEALEPGLEWVEKGRRWVASENFVTFTSQHARARNIVLSLRGNPDEFLPFAELPLREGMGHGAYTECTLERADQLPAAAMYVRQAHELYVAGRARLRKQRVIQER
jgi:hypothetical protein